MKTIAFAALAVLGTRSWHPQFRRTSTRGQLLLRYESGS